MKIINFFIQVTQLRQKIKDNKKARYILISIFIFMFSATFILRKMGLVSDSAFKKALIPAKCGVCPNLKYCGGCISKGCTTCWQ